MQIDDSREKIDLQLLVQSLLHKHEELLDNVLQNVEPPKGHITHYTSLDGALGILQNEKFWLTEAAYLNDPTELQNGLNIMNQVIPDIIYNLVSQNEQLAAGFIATLHYAIMSCFSLEREEVKRWKQEWINNVVYGAFSPGIFHKRWHVFISCFSKVGDSIGQWRPYGDDGKGVALTFDIDKEWITKDSSYLISLCYKDESTKRDFLTLFINFVATQISAYQKDRKGRTEVHVIQSELDQLFRACFELLSGDLIACKNDSYKDESEIRLFKVYSGEQIKNKNLVKLNYRIHNGICKSVLEMDFTKSCLKEIRLGPKCHSSNLLALTEFADRNDFDVKVLSSSIPYR